HLVVVLESQMPEAFGNGIQAGSFRLVPERVVGVGTVDDLGHQNDGWIARKTVLLHQRIERALLAVVSELHTFHIVGRGALALGDLQHLVGRHEQEFGLRIYELADQPGTGDAVHLHLLTSHPLHVEPPSTIGLPICSIRPRASCTRCRCACSPPDIPSSSARCRARSSICHASRMASFSSAEMALASTTSMGCLKRLAGFSLAIPACT